MRWGVGSAQVLLLVVLVIVGLGPLLWLAKSAITPTPDTITHPMALFPHGAAWSNLREAWSTSTSAATSGTRSCSRSARGSVQIVVATTGGLRAVGAAAEVRRASSWVSC